MPTQPALSGIIDLPIHRFEEAVEIYTAAFDRDPYMLHVLGADDLRRAAGIRAMYRWVLVDAQLPMGWQLKAALDGEDGQHSPVTGIALLYPPGGHDDWPEPVVAAWERFRALIGPESSERLDHMNEAVALRRPRQPHIYLSDLAVHPRYQGQGQGGRLIAAVSALSAAHPTSAGVALDTENARNVTLYEHFGYHVTDHYFVDGLETWSLFCPNP